MRDRFRDAEHVFRVGLIFALLVVAFLLLRAWFIPDDFGVYGFYRAGALDDNRVRPPQYAGHSTCADCHADVVDTRRGSRHERVACEACHGPLGRHAAGEDEATPARPDGRASCIRCHDARAGKPAGFPQVVVADHADEGPCTACHQPHSPAIR